MFHVRVYAFTKKDNSTKRPPTDQGNIYQGELKEECTINSPVIKLNIPADTPARWNYAYIAIFQRFYFISNWEWSEGWWIAHMEVDRLATYRAEIGASFEYILRSSNRYDGNISDAMYPALTRTLCKEVKLTNQLQNSIATGCYLLAVISKSTNGVGSTSVYALSNSQFREFNNIMMSGVDWLNVDFSTIGDMNDSFFKTLFNPYQYVVSCTWLPLSLSQIDGVDAPGIPYGWWTIAVSCKRVTRLEYNNTATCKLPVHPQSARGNYLNFQPYTKLMLHWPCFGDFELDPLAYYHGRTCNIHYTIDLITGRGACYPVTSFSPNESDPVIYSAVQGQVGVPVAVSQMATNIVGALQSIGGTVGDTLQSGLSMDLMGAGQSLIGGMINSSINLHRPTYNLVGSTGGFNDMVGDYSQSQVECTFTYVSGEDLEHNGRPLYQEARISDIPGYILCENSQIELTAPLEDQQAVRAFMNGGFYYE